MAINRVQIASTTANVGTAETLTISPTGAGNLLVVAAMNADITSGLTIADNQLSSYTQEDTFAFLGAAQVVVWYAANIAAGITTIVLANGANNNFYTIAAEYSGVQLTSPVDQFAPFSNTGFGPGSFASSPNVTTTQAVELMVGICVNNGGGAGVALASPWTNASGAVGYGSYFLTFAEQIVSSIQTSANVSGTMPGGNCTSDLISFFGAGGAPTPTNMLLTLLGVGT
jgi:hypothetical protein